MKVASKVMYIIGMIANVIMFLLAIALLVIFVIGKVNPDFANQIIESMKDSFPGVSNLMDLGLGASIYLLLSNLIVLLLATRAIRNLNKNTGRIGLHILLMIGGILCWDVFYFLGGLFGIIGGSRDQ